MFVPIIVSLLKFDFVGVTRSNIIKVDPKTMTTLREWDWTQMRRWSAIRDAFTLDFGDYEDDYVVLICEDADGYPPPAFHSSLSLEPCCDLYFVLALLLVLCLSGPFPEI